MLLIMDSLNKSINLEEEKKGIWFYLHLFIRSSIWPLCAPYDSVRYCKTYLADSVLPELSK
jgi:hypothetical protein